MRTKVIAGWFAVALMLTGALQPVALAQQSQPDLYKAAVDNSTPAERGVDLYDVGAVFVTLAKTPFNIGLCALGGVLGTGLFLVTLGSGYKASARVVEEGCSGPWIVGGNDLRPDTSRRE